MSARIETVQPGSPAAKAGIRPGDIMEAVNGHPIRDVLDYRFYTYEPKLKLTLNRLGGKLRAVSLRHGEGEDLGLGFSTYLMDSHRHCQNRCVFCFVDQMPKGCRESLYVKDDDARLSFFLGNYITLTNLSEEDIRRIVDMRVSPLHVSVHTTHGALRAKMMGNPHAASGLETLRRFAGARLILHTQIVLCPGYNDGAELARTLDDLKALGDCVESVAIVPVGLTRHREGLAALRPLTPEEAADTIALAARYERVYCADELYLTAGRLGVGIPSLPEAGRYDGYPQLENGVGMIRSFMDDFAFAAEGQSPNPQPISIATGVSFAPFLRKLAPTALVYAIRNDFFGETVNVAGLVVGADLVAQLKGRDLGERLLIPANMLRHSGEVFLDGLTPDGVSRELGVPVAVVLPDGAALAEELYNESTRGNTT